MLYCDLIYGIMVVMPKYKLRSTGTPLNITEETALNMGLLVVNVDEEDPKAATQPNPNTKKTSKEGS